MTTTNVAPTGAVSNHVQRRGFLAAIGMTAAVIPAMAMPPAPGPGLPTVGISMLARRIKSLVDRDEILEKSGDVSPETEAEISKIFFEKKALEDLALTLEPATIDEALFVQLVALSRINYGMAIENGGDEVDGAETALRGTTAILARALEVDLEPLSGELYLPVYLAPSYLKTGRA